LKTKSVLIIEDELETAEMLAEMLRLNHFRPLISNGKYAFSLLQQEKPDGVVLDLMMPDVSGMEILRYIRCHPHLSATPVIIVSAKCLPTDVQAGLDAGATGYMVKPVGYREFIRIMQVSLGAEGTPGRPA
jgi:DNA-binding response OmpR family regulator